MAVTAQPATPPALEARSLYRFYRAGDEETLALQGVSLRLEAGEFVAVAGPSGSGKSTLLACLAGMDDPDGGSVRIAGQRISHRPEPERARIRARHIGMLFQNANLLDHLTVAQNLSLVRSLAGRAHRADRPDLLSLLGLSERAAAYPGQLSGGELARAGLAIALANTPPRCSPTNPPVNWTASPNHGCWTCCPTPPPAAPRSWSPATAPRSPPPRPASYASTTDGCADDQ